MRVFCCFQLVGRNVAIESRESDVDRLPALADVVEFEPGRN
jgi:hypothetical protein